MPNFEWLNENSRKVLERGYLVEGQTPEQRIRVIAETAEKYLGMSGFADKFFGYMSKGYYSLASPIWSNYGTNRGLPVSCFGSYLDDNMDSILFSHAENGKLIQGGGGTSGYFGALRPRGAPITGNGESSGAVHFMQLFDKLADVVSQGSTRRGFFSAYLPVEHPDILEFLDIGTEGNPIQGLTYGVTVGDAWMNAMIAGDSDKRKIWAKIIQRRGELGYPYIMFSDTANNSKPQVYKDLDKTIYASNMCSEIMLPSNKDETFVCVLSSMNLLHYDEWKDTDAVETLTAFLDTVVTEFVSKLEATGSEFHKRALKFAKEHRALGLGVLGWHSYLQSKTIPFESQEALKLNNEIFKLIQTKATQASKELAMLFGEPLLLTGTGLRNTTTMAVAPTKSSSFILGQVSQSIEPEFSNCYVKDLAKTKVTVKNPYLTELLESIGKNTDEVWQSIKENDGSVQHLDFLREDEKAVFRTFSEIKPTAIIDQAGLRQQYIDQGQSLNLMVTPSATAKEINELYIRAWRMGVKALYYQFSMNAAQELSRKKLKDISCSSCEG